MKKMVYNTSNISHTSSNNILLSNNNKIPQFRSYRNTHHIKCQWTVIQYNSNSWSIFIIIQTRNQLWNPHKYPPPFTHAMLYPLSSLPPIKIMTTQWPSQKIACYRGWVWLAWFYSVVVDVVVVVEVHWHISYFNFQYLFYYCIRAQL